MPKASSSWTGQRRRGPRQPSGHQRAFELSSAVVGLPPLPRGWNQCLSSCLCPCSRCLLPGLCAPDFSSLEALEAFLLWPPAAILLAPACGEEKTSPGRASCVLLPPLWCSEVEAKPGQGSDSSRVTRPSARSEWRPEGRAADP